MLYRVFRWNPHKLQDIVPLIKPRQNSPMKEWPKIVHLGDTTKNRIYAGSRVVEVVFGRSNLLTSFILGEPSKNLNGLF